MNRYTTRPHDALMIDYQADLSSTADQIIIEDEEHKPTGLLDANGQKLYRARDRVPFGFIRS